jgi:hypothetical protein
MISSVRTPTTNRIQEGKRTFRKPIELLHPATWLDVRHRGVGLADGVNGEHRRVQDAGHTIRKGLNPLSMHVLAEEHVGQVTGMAKSKGSLSLAAKGAGGFRELACVHRRSGVHGALLPESAGDGKDKVALCN